METAGCYLVSISLPLLVRRRRYSVPSCSKTASRPPSRISLTAMRLTGLLDDLAGLPDILFPHLRKPSDHTCPVFASNSQLHSQRTASPDGNRLFSMSYHAGTGPLGTLAITMARQLAFQIGVATTSQPQPGVRVGCM